MADLEALTTQGETLDGYLLERGSRQRQIIDLLTQVGSDLVSSDVVSGFELYSGHDVHAYYRYRQDPNSVIHVQAYPGLSDATSVNVFIREMDYQKLTELRAQMAKQGGPSIGNEGDAVRRVIRDQMNISNHPRVLTAILSGENPGEGDIIEGSAVPVRNLSLPLG